MTSIYNSVFSTEELEYLNALPQVLSAKASLDSRTSGNVYFSIPVTEHIHTTLQERFGLYISIGSSIPMRWIKGDTAPHIDRGASQFENTYLVYLNDSPGEFVIDSQSYPIESNTGFVFNEGVNHRTINTGTEPRLLMGPMSENGFAVGLAPPIRYYPTQEDALNGTNFLGQTDGSFLVGNVTSGSTGGYTSWRIASNSSGPANQTLVYTNGQTLDGTLGENYYNLYPTIPCFLEGTTILCQVDGVDTYIPVEKLKNGTLVKTSLDGYKKVVGVGNGSIQNPGTDERTENRLYKCSPSKYPSLTEDLYITGCHSILEFLITDKQKEDTIKHLGKLFVTDKKYRLIACVDERADPWNSEGHYTIYHFALEHENVAMNYGVYANGGLLVETCSIRTLKNRSNMALIGF
jgi:hypothetical protein